MCAGVGVSIDAACLLGNQPDMIFEGDRHPSRDFVGGRRNSLE
jgi:hypothetical protein